tara:strand:- start:3484 stop:5385 length:1902 start_codon:yes stop_codon:yes gene_type:complete
MNFRYDINGLRAIAVIAVVIFHFEPTWLQGGFAGVDVFFVISGFLMTGIIFRGLERGDFNLFKFYVARANRIVPALAFLCLCLFFLGWFFSSSFDYKSLAKHIFGSMTFFSNVIYWKESGYFDVASNEKWLLHTWSLSVEWQFYIIYPIILVVLKRFFSLLQIRGIMLIGTVLGFLFSVVVTHKWPDAAYYLLPTRAWEMMMGGIAFLFPLNLSEGKKKVTEFFGFSLIIFSYFFVSNKTPWPGSFALMPVLGAYFMIVSNRQSSVITNNALFQSLGRASYSIYLWHWPIVVYGYLFYVESWTFYGMILSVIFGFTSYKFIEKYNLKSYSTWYNLVKVIPVYMILLTTSVSAVVYLNEGIPYEYRQGANSSKSKFLDSYHPDNYLTPYIYSQLREECNFFDSVASSAKDNGIVNSCVTTSKNSITSVLLWGDSHAQALSYGLRNEFPEIDFLQVASSACRPGIGPDELTSGELKKSCDRSNRLAFDTLIKENPDFVILAQRNKHDLNDYNKIVSKARGYGNTSKFLLVGPVPQWKPSLPRAIAMRHFNTQDTYFDDPYFLNDVFRLDSILKKKYTDADLVYVSLTDELCDKKGCLAKVDNENTPLVWDYGHLSLKGSIYVAKNIIGPKLTSGL